MSDFDHNIFSLFITDNLLELKQALDEYLMKIPYNSKFKFFDKIEFIIIPEINISIDTQQNGLNFLIDMSSWEVGKAKEKVKFLEKYITEKRKYYQNIKNLNESKIDIIASLMFDTHFVLDLIKNQISERDYKKYIIASNRELFDNIKLQNYFSTLNSTTPYLTTRLKEILLRINDIINFDNEIINEIKNETSQKNINNVIDFGDGIKIYMRYNYECIVIEEINKTYISLHDEENRIRFYANHNYVIEEINEFANKTNKICRTITSFLNINTKEYLNLFLHGSDTSNEYMSNIKDSLEIEIITQSENPEMFENKISLTSQRQEIKQKHPEYNPKLWDNECFELFKFLFDKYYDNGTKRELLNIWFFLKQHKDTKNSIYATKEKYKEFILDSYQINITNKAIPDNWHEIEFQKIKGFFSLYNS